MALPARLDRGLDRKLRARARGRPGALRHHAPRRRHQPRLGRADLSVDRARPRAAAATMVLRSGARPATSSSSRARSATPRSASRVRSARSIRSRRGGAAKHLLDRYLHPQPRLALAPRLRRTPPAPWTFPTASSATSAISAMCPASAATSTRRAVPLSTPAARLVAADPSALETRADRRRRLRDPRRDRARRRGRIRTAARRAGVPVTPIGRVTKGQGPPTVLAADGRPLDSATHRSITSPGERCRRGR